MRGGWEAEDEGGGASLVVGGGSTGACEVWRDKDRAKTVVTELNILSPIVGWQSRTSNTHTPQKVNKLEYHWEDSFKMELSCVLLPACLAPLLLISI